MLLYRSDIDGLRAYAVLSVLLYHVGFSFVSGGFVGVDIFFVISGYLMTKIIKKELDNNSFSVKDFFIRRIKRLFPALIFVFILTSIATYLIFPFSMRSETIIQNIYALYGISNINFWMESGYFDNDKFLKPMLHTWSLGVEEQFYIFWVILLLLAYKFAKDRLLHTMVFLIIISFGFNAIFLSEYFINTFVQDDLDFFSFDKIKSTVFFMMPFRIFEFAIGGALVFISIKDNKLQNITSLIGVFILFYYFINFSSDKVFPYYNALIVVIGTALIILSKDSFLSKLLLENKPTIFIGKISYSLYLVHWPLIIFWFYLDDKITDIDRFIIVVISIVISILMYKNIEQKFRTKNKSNYLYILKFIVFIFILTIVFLGISKINNFSQEERVNKIISNQISIQENVKLINSTKDYSEFKGKLIKILTIGDSMGNDINALLTFTKEYNNQFELRHYFISHKCQFIEFDRNQIDYYKNDNNLIDVCDKTTNEILNSNRLRESDIVIINFNWYNFIPQEGFENIIKSLKKKTYGKIIILGKRPYFTKGASQYISSLLLDYKDIDNFEKYIYDKKNMDPINNSIQNYSENLGLRFIDTTDFLCNDKKQICYMFDKEDNLLYRDSFHFSIYGAKYFAQDFYDKFLKKDIDLIIKGYKNE
ncbi:acyltransferase family protein [Aliarcobacter lanthieri]|uniref:acyltransferase family protein n=1 Tax=Aliarcobacter lanthieri TaxID=1355374 RepID=UPI00047C04FC|nr:acyltransferase family protein [Aliarcobacter lanthieri]